MDFLSIINLVCEEQIFIPKVQPREENVKSTARDHLISSQDAPPQQLPDYKTDIWIEALSEKKNMTSRFCPTRVSNPRS